MGAVEVSVALGLMNAVIAGSAAQLNRAAPAPMPQRRLP